LVHQVDSPSSLGWLWGPGPLWIWAFALTLNSHQYRLHLPVQPFSLLSPWFHQSLQILVQYQHPHQTLKEYLGPSSLLPGALVGFEAGSLGNPWGFEERQAFVEVLPRQTPWVCWTIHPLLVVVLHPVWVLYRVPQGMVAVPLVRLVGLLDSPVQEGGLQGGLLLEVEQGVDSQGKMLSLSTSFPSPSASSLLPLQLSSSVLLAHPVVFAD